MNKIENAKELYTKLRQAESHLRAIRKVMIALPKKKEKRYEQILADKLVAYKNAQNKFQHATKDLNTEEFAELHEAVYE